MPESETSAWSPPDSLSFEHAEIVFKENFAQFRHLNEQMNRIPPFAVTLTGGFWYISVVADYGDALPVNLEQLARFSLMLFSSICNFMLVFISIRIRDVMSEYLASVQRFEGIWWPKRVKSLPWFRNYSMITMYAVLILAAGLMSLVGGFVLFWPSDLAPLWVGLIATPIVLAVLIGLAYATTTWLTRPNATVTNDAGSAPT